MVRRYIWSTPNTFLKKLQSIDSKAIKLAIGVPLHTNKSYAEAGMISLSEQRKLAVSKYVTRSIAIINSVTEEILKIQIKTIPKELKTCHLVSQSEII